MVFTPSSSEPSPKNAADRKPLTTVITEEAGVTEKVRPCLLKEVK